MTLTLSPGTVVEDDPKLDPPGGGVVILGPAPGHYVLACGDCGALVCLHDLVWRRDGPACAVDAVVCRRCALREAS